MKKWLLRILVVFLLFVAGVAIWVLRNRRDRHPDYQVDLHIKPGQQPGRLTVGFGLQTITPTISDTWNDVNKDARYREEDGDTYNDLNNNGKFDPVWIAGFHNRKPANGIHDEVWARAMVIDDGNTRLAFVVLDAIGFMHDDVVDIRELIPEEWGIDYTMIASTHTHESNDLIGIWGPDEFHSGVDPQEMERLKQQTVKAIAQAIESSRPAKLLFAQDISGTDEALVKDTRKPIVKAPGVFVMHVVDAETDATLGTLVNWANHPEVLWSKNLLISSDFPHYIREAVEKGVVSDTTRLKAGLGGTTIYFNGAIGGLMAPHPSIGIPDAFTDSLYFEPSYDKAKAIGDQIGLMALGAVENPDTVIERASISIRAKTLTMELDNPMLLLASSIGLLNRGGPGINTLRTEVAAFKVGPATFLCIPGEIYPEILHGGVENPAGRDFDIEPIEVPAIQNQMPGKYRFYVGLANDEIGYIIPKSEWDNELPYLYLDERDTYGEENSLGPNTGPVIYQELLNILNELKQ
ncbi:hypothetical protein QQ020_33680 [Fulvivirgaceae bacterium BMA12]|uniref:Neutral/alkaline non-lysosomal ceramidase N-terminal domain-containing protein n=1 Tax=Agaribacillus aureus TaxID=3051825 RepID=A0ABT8LKW9_9BACT|nr:hypothetical protein [Fulvivirgaceae bacterium BMA12]